MSVKEEMREIEATIEESIDVARKRDAAKKAKSRKKAYEKALREVQRIAGDGQMRTLADWIRGEIRETESFPSGRTVRQKGADICRQSGNEVSTGSWLGA